MDERPASRGLMQRASLSLAAGLGAALTQVLLRTVRVEHLGRGPMERLEAEGRGLIYAVWHGQILLWSLTHAGRGIHALVSHHRDGELIARILAWLGNHSVRGSSTHGGREALQELVVLVSRGVGVALTPDGPRGPRHVLKPGVVALARESGRPIVCAANAYDRYWALGSWDRFAIPAPFARAVACYGEPIYVPRDAPPEALEGIRSGVEGCLRELTARAEASVRGPAGVGRWPWVAEAAAVVLGPVAALALAALAVPAGVASAPRAAFVASISLVAAALLAAHRGGAPRGGLAGQAAVATAAGLGAGLLGAPAGAALAAALVVLAFGLAVGEAARLGGRSAGLALAALALALPLLSGPVVEALPSAAARGAATSGLLGASPVTAVVGSALGVDLLRRREAYALSALGAYHPYAYPPWGRTVAGYLALALALAVARGRADRRGRRAAPLSGLAALAAVVGGAGALAAPAHEGPPVVPTSEARPSVELGVDLRVLALGGAVRADRGGLQGDRVDLGTELDPRGGASAVWNAMVLRDRGHRVEWGYGETRFRGDRHTSPTGFLFDGRSFAAGDPLDGELFLRAARLGYRHTLAEPLGVRLEAGLRASALERILDLGVVGRGAPVQARVQWLWAAPELGLSWWASGRLGVEGAVAAVEYKRSRDEMRAVEAEGGLVYRAARAVRLVAGWEGADLALERAGKHRTRLRTSGPGLRVVLEF